MSNILIAEDFEVLADRPWILVGAKGTLTLECKEVRRLRSPSPRTAPSFAVVWRDRGAARALPQGNYSTDLGARGTAELFVVPIGPDGEGMCYEAIFN
ncbi:MAG: hypothetical protein ABJB02_02615 [Dokdonella sp.]